MKSEKSSIENENEINKTNLTFNNPEKNNSIQEKNLLSMHNFISSRGNFSKVTEDGLVLKKIVLKGFGKSTPLKGEEVFVNYIAELEDGRSVDNTLILKEPKQIIMGKNNCLPGLEIAIKSMVAGEKAKIVVFPEYGILLHDEIKNKLKEDQNSNEVYQKEKLLNLKLNNINYPSIAEINHLELKDLKKYLPIIYDIELVKIDKPRKNREYADVTEKMTEASDLKNEGNQLFREKRFREALIKYNTGLNYFFKIPTDDLKTNKLIDLKQTLILNIINCHIALFEYSYALKRLIEAFEIKETPKCYFYRAMASMNLGDFEQAEKDIEKLKQLIRNDKQVLGLENDLNNLKKKTISEKRSLFKKGIFMQAASNENIFDKKEILKLPIFDPTNFCFFFDILINNNTKMPLKVKFEIFDIFVKNETENSFLNYLNIIIKEKKLVNSNLEIIQTSDVTKEDFLLKILEISSEQSDESLLKFLDFDKTKYHNAFPPIEDGLLAIRKNYNGKTDLVIIPYKLTLEKPHNLYIVGRMFYNNDNFKNISNKIKDGEKIEIRIIESDKSFNI